MVARNPIMVARADAYRRGDRTLSDRLDSILSSGNPLPDLRQAIVECERHAASVVLCAREPARGILLASIRQRHAVLNQLVMNLEAITDAIPERGRPRPIPLRGRAV